MVWRKVQVARPSCSTSGGQWAGLGGSGWSAVVVAAARAAATDEAPVLEVVEEDAFCV